MDTRVDEIADRIFRLSTFVPDVGPTGFTYNQFLVDAEEPLVFHTEARGMFPLVSEAIATVMPIERVRWITFGHLEADECGAMNEFLAVAPDARSRTAHSVAWCRSTISPTVCPGPSGRTRSSTSVASGCATSTVRAGGAGDACYGLHNGPPLCEAIERSTSHSARPSLCRDRASARRHRSGVVSADRRRGRHSERQDLAVVGTSTRNHG